jgi:myo-inositol-1-phosphate synthase
MAGQINVALVGVGNNASALIQGWARSRAAEDNSDLLAGFTVSDFRFVAGFDISDTKIGADLSEAIFLAPTNFPSVQEVPKLDVQVAPAPILDGLDRGLAEIISAERREISMHDIAGQLKEAAADVVINFTPSGSPMAAVFYAKAALEAGCAYINATPDPVARDARLAKLFQVRGLPVLGDDLESQMGATVLHRAILETLDKKRLRVTGSYQINVGGNMDFRNLSVRGDSKRESKRRGLMVDADLADVHVIPAADCFPFLEDRKVAHIKVETEGWLGSRNSVEVRLEIQDSSSAAAVVADLIRIAKFELNAGRAGVVDEAGFFFKSPIIKRPLHEAKTLLGRYRAR